MRHQPSEIGNLNVYKKLSKVMDNYNYLYVSRQISLRMDMPWEQKIARAKAFATKLIT